MRAHHAAAATATLLTALALTGCTTPDESNDDGLSADITVYPNNTTDEPTTPHPSTPASRTPQHSYAEGSLGSPTRE